MQDLLTWIIGIGVTGFVGGFNDGRRVILTIKEIEDALASKKES